MQVVLQTQTELVVHDGRWTTVLMGAIFSAMGGGVMWLRWTHPTGWSGNAGPWLVYLIGTVFVVVGVVIFWFSADRRYIVDRSARTVRIVVQRLVHQQTTFLAFKDIDDVALEQSAGMNTNSNSARTPTWRVVFLMKDGSRVPWTLYLPNPRTRRGGWPGAVAPSGEGTGDPDHKAQPTTPTPALISHPVATNW